MHNIYALRKTRKNNENIIMNGFVKGWLSAPEEYVEPILLKQSSFLLKIVLPAMEQQKKLQ